MSAWGLFSWRHLGLLGGVRCWFSCSKFRHESLDLQFLSSSHGKKTIGNASAELSQTIFPLWPWYAMVMPCNRRSLASMWLHKRLDIVQSLAARRCCAFLSCWRMVQYVQVTFPLFTLLITRIYKTVTKMHPVVPDACVWNCNYHIATWVEHLKVACKDREPLTFHLYKKEAALNNEWPWAWSSNIMKYRGHEAFKVGTSWVKKRGKLSDTRIRQTFSAGSASFLRFRERWRQELSRSCPKCISVIPPKLTLCTQQAVGVYEDMIELLIAYIYI